MARDDGVGRVVGREDHVDPEAESFDQHREVVVEPVGADHHLRVVFHEPKGIGRAGIRPTRPGGERPTRWR